MLSGKGRRGNGEKSEKGKYYFSRKLLSYKIVSGIEGETHRI